MVTVSPTRANNNDPQESGPKRGWYLFHVVQLKSGRTLMLCTLGFYVNTFTSLLAAIVKRLLLLSLIHI